MCFLSRYTLFISGYLSISWILSIGTYSYVFRISSTFTRWHWRYLQCTDSCVHRLDFDWYVLVSSVEQVLLYWFQRECWSFISLLSIDSAHHNFRRRSHKSNRSLTRASKSTYQPGKYHSICHIFGGEIISTLSLFMYWRGKVIIFGSHHERKQRDRFMETRAVVLRARGAAVHAAAVIFWCPP